MPMVINGLGKSFALPLLLACVIISCPSYAAENTILDPPNVCSDTLDFSCTDDLSECDEKFKPKQLILPASLIAVGTLGVNNGCFRKLNNSVRKGMDDLRGNHYFRVDNYIQYLPAVAYIGLDFAGVKSKHTFRERLVVGATAHIAMAVVVNTVKHMVREKRPDSNSRNSFPSGHTATVFTGAELVREEYGTVVGITAYTVATGVAFLRIYNGRHWLNDVIAGAGVGILSARIGYWMLPVYKRWFGWDDCNTKDSFVLAPGFNYSDRSVLVHFNYTF